MKHYFYSLLILSGSLLGCLNAAAVTVGQIDDFEDGTVAAWSKGANTMSPPTNVASGGPTGSNDNYLETVSTGGAGSDSRQVIFNRSQWTGNYIAAGVAAIGMQLRNGGNASVPVRIALNGGASTWFVSAQPFNLPADGNWYGANFELAAQNFMSVEGSDSFANVLTSVTDVRILVSQTGTNFRGDPIESTLGVDSIEAREADTDGDGVPDSQDAFPNDPSETTDTDGDGIGNNADPDDDNDGVPDDMDDYPLGRFDDAGVGYWAFTFIEALARSGITGGCGGDNYCPNSPVTRAQMAVFLERGINGSSFVPPAASGNVFLDVGATDFAANFIERLYMDGITSGCSANQFCPGQSVTRAQMAVFLLRAKHGAAFVPPAPVGTFGDVTVAYWAAGWIEQLAAEGITGGCGDGNYCPEEPVTRAQMAVFLVRAFDL